MHKETKVTVKSQWFSLSVILGLLLMAGIGQNHIDSYMQTVNAAYIQSQSEQRAKSFEDLRMRVEQYRIAYLARDYDTMYQLTYFKGGVKPSLIEFRNLRDPQSVYKLDVRFVDMEMADTSAKVSLELALEHPAIGRSQSVHVQEWEKLNDLWYRVDYGY